MKSDIYRFAGEITPAETTVSPAVDRGTGTVEGLYARDGRFCMDLYDAISPELTESDPLPIFADVSPQIPIPERGALLNDFEDSTGVCPGLPTIKLLDEAPEATPEDMLGSTDEVVAERLQSFYASTGLLPHIAEESSSSGSGSWGGDANKLYARIRVPAEEPNMKSLLHELGHCSMPKLGLRFESETEVIGSTYSLIRNAEIISGGLVYDVNGESKGTILEEAVAEGLGILANRKLGLVRTHYTDEVQRLPDIVAPYLELDGDGFSYSAPAAVALELIAKEIGLPADRYFRMFVDYANVGVQNMDARQEIAETIYRGTRGKLTLNQIEELPYPINKAASLALLWAVEDVLEVPDHERYSDIFRF